MPKEAHKPTHHTNELKLEPDRPSRSSRRWWVAAVVVAVLAAGGGWYFFFRQAPAAPGQGRQGPPQIMVPIMATAVRVGDIGVYIEALGTVTPVYTATITSRVQGEIVAVNYREGQLVRKNDSLLEIDPRPYAAALTQAEGQLAHDQAVLEQAKIDLERYKLAYARNAIPKQQLDDQEQIVLQDDGTVKADQGNVENARLNVAYCHLRAPFEGRVGLRLVDPGNIVQANSSTALAVITQLQPITVIFSVSEDHLGEIQEQLRQGHTMPVELFDRARVKKLATGTLLTIDNQVDTTTGTVKLKALVPNKDEALFPNQFVNVRLLVTTRRDATLIPTAAIQRNARGTFAYVITQDQTAAMRPITVGPIDGDSASVEGLKPDDTVATNGFDKLQEGMHVAIRDRVAPPPPVAGAGPGAAAGPGSGSGQRPGMGPGQGGDARPGPGPGSSADPRPGTDSRSGTGTNPGGRP